MASLSGHSSSLITMDRLTVPVTVQPGSVMLDMDIKAISAPEIRQIPDVDSLPGNLKILSKHDVVNLHSEWVADTIGPGTYRYLHYNAYGKDGTKFLEGDIENAYDSCCGCCLGCQPREVKIHVRNRGGTDLFSILLTGKLRKSPIDTAEIIAGDGTMFATVSWKSSSFEVTDMANNTILILKVKKCYICTMDMVHRVVDPETDEVIGTIESMYPITGSAILSDGGMLTTTIPEHMNIKQRVAWIALMFLLKLSHRGREYAKISRVLY